MTKNQPSRLVLADLLRADSLRKITAVDIAHFESVRKALNVRQEYKEEWPWGAAAQYLYRALIQALGCDEDEENGRKEERETARRILALREEGKSVPEIQRVLETEGKFRSKEAVASYLKPVENGATA
jgi:hypothetical protein